MKSQLELSFILTRSESSFVMVDPDQCPQNLGLVFFDFQSPFGHHRGKIKLPEKADAPTIFEIDQKEYQTNISPLFNSEQIKRFVPRRDKVVLQQ